MSEEAILTLQDTAQDVSDAKRSLGALRELLSGCAPDHPLQAGSLLGLIKPLCLMLENAEGGMRVLCRTH